VVYLGIYAFNNPEPAAWYIETSEDTGILVGVAPADGTEGVTDVHGNMVRWFTWVFANNMICFAAPIFMGAVSCMTASCPSVTKACGAIVGGGWCLSATVAFIMGYIWRFNTAAMYACGDDLEDNTTIEAWQLTEPLNQYSSGLFMMVYYWIIVIMLAICATCYLIK